MTTTTPLAEVLAGLSPDQLAELVRLAQQEPKLQQTTADPEPAKEAKKAKKAPRQEIKYYTEGELERLFAQITDTRDKAIFRVAYHRGLRASEVGLLQLEDLSMKDERLHVHRVKGSRGGPYHLTSVEIRTLRPWLKLRGSDPGPLFPSRQGRPIGQPRLDQLIKAYGAKAGLPAAKNHMHSLRHACATHLLNKGVSIDQIRDHIGHRSIKNTMVYADAGDRQRIERDRRLRSWE